MPSPRYFSLICLFAALWNTAALAYDPANGDFAREDADHVRVLSYNNEINFVADLSVSAEFARILGRLDPDIIAFQEVNSGLSASQISTELAAITGDAWSVHLGIATPPIKNGLCVRHGSRTNGFIPGTLITDTVPASELRGVTAGLVDVLAGSTDFYVMSVHFKSGGTSTDNARRQEHVDAIINWQRDLRTFGEEADLSANTPMLVVGDMNFQGSGPPNPDVTIVDGDIFDEVTYGMDSPPDWDGTDALDVAPLDANTSDPATFSSDPLAGSYLTRRFDRFVVTDSAVSVENSFILNTATMTSTELAFAAPALVSSDTASAADHLPVVVDFTFLVAGSPAPGSLLINEFITTPTASEAIELLNLTGTTFDLAGAVVTAGSVSHTVSSGVILPANGHVVLTETNTSATAPFIPNEGGTISIASSDENTIFDTIAYGTAGEVPAPIFGESAARTAITGDAGDDWNLDDAHTMGTANDAVAAALGSGTVFLNEVYHNPATGEDVFIELHNSGGAPVDISGWQIIVDDDYDIPASTTIPAGGFFLLTASDLGFPAFMDIDAGADNVYLLDATGARVDQVGWTSAGNVGESLTVDPDGDRTDFDAFDDATNATDWSAHAPTPGTTVPVELTIFTAD